MDRKAIVGGLGAAAVAALIVGAMGGGISLLHARAADQPAPEARPPLAGAAMTVRMEDGYAVRDRFVGRLEPAREAKLAFERQGLVVAVLADEGRAVAAGDVVARLDASALIAERDRLAAERDRALANLDLAERTLKRQQALAGQGHAAAQTLDEARLAVEARRADAAAMDAAIRKLDIDIAKTEIRAPFAGTVAARHLDEGAVVAPGAPVVDLLESARPLARIGVSPEAADALAAGATAELRVAGRVVPATLDSLRPDLAAATRTATALFALAPLPGVPFGRIVTLEVERRVDARGAWVPKSALSEGAKGLWSVYTLAGVRDGAGEIAREAVEVLHLDGERAFVRGTLADGALVVRAGAHRVPPGQRVAVAAADLEG